MANTKQIKCTEACPGVLIQEGVRFNEAAAKRYFAPFVGKTIKEVVLQQDEESHDPMIVLQFEEGGAAFILADAEGNGPGFIEYAE